MTAVSRSLAIGQGATARVGEAALLGRAAA